MVLLDMVFYHRPKKKKNPKTLLFYFHFINEHTEEAWKCAVISSKSQQLCDSRDGCGGRIMRDVQGHYALAPHLKQVCICLSVCVSIICIYIQMPMEAIGVIGGHQQPDVGAGNRTVLWNSSKFLLTVSPAPLHLLSADRISLCCPGWLSSLSIPSKGDYKSVTTKPSVALKHL